MIEKIPIQAYSERRNPNNQIWFLHHNQISIKQGLNSLYQSSKFQNKSIYGIKLYQKQQQQHSKFKPADLSIKTKAYIAGCYWLLNWQAMTIKDVSNLIQTLPWSENQIEEISVEDYSLKFRKNNVALYYSLANGQLQVKQNKYLFNSCDKSGKNPLLEYQKSVKKLTINSISYYFDEKIKIVQSCESFAAVYTDNYLYIFSLKLNPGQRSRFPISNCCDAKWSDKGLYFLQQNGTIGLIQKQRTFIDNYNKIGFSLANIMEQSAVDQQYTCSRLIIHKDMVIGLFFHTSFHEKIMLRIINHRLAGRAQKSYKFQLNPFKGEILYQNALSFHDYIVIMLCTGQNGSIQSVHEYIFGSS